MEIVEAHVLAREHIHDGRGGHPAPGIHPAIHRVVGSTHKLLDLDRQRFAFEGGLLIVRRHLCPELAIGGQQRFLAVVERDKEAGGQVGGLEDERVADLAGERAQFGLALDLLEAASGRGADPVAKSAAHRQFIETEFSRGPGYARQPESWRQSGTDADVMLDHVD